ncbi:MAG: carbonic anhydrase [Pseudanabaenaceae cyanobacterium]
MSKSKPCDVDGRNSCSCCVLTRRHFLERILAIGLVSSTSLMFPQIVQANEHRAQALVLTCIDFRFVNLEQSFLARQHLDQAYDWVALAGASLALTGFPHPAEAEAFWDQLALSKRLHNIRKVVIIDHQDCGAYASIRKEKFADLTSEQNLHAQYLTQAYEQIRQRYPDLEVELYFAELTGNFRLISPPQIT